MVRETSIKSYNTIKDNGLLSEKRWRVYDIVFNHGPLIGSKAAFIYKGKYGFGSNSETIRNRLTELRNMGVVREVGKALDQDTGMTVILWDVTKSVPIKFDVPKKTKMPYLQRSWVYFNSTS